LSARSVALVFHLSDELITSILLIPYVLKLRRGNFRRRGLGAILILPAGDCQIICRKDHLDEDLIASSGPP